MPTRILREGILTSETVNKLSDTAELFYRRLMSVADDYGRYFAHPAILRGACYPLKVNSIREADVKQMLSECTAIGLIVIYGGGTYLQINNFGQQTRSKSKFPEPTQDELLSKCKANDKQMLSLVGDGVVVEGVVEGVVESAKPGFARPSLDAVKLHGAKIGLPDEECLKFHAYYESNGWKVGRNAMKNWQAAMIHWRSNWQGSRKPTLKPESRERQEVIELKRLN